MRHYQPSVAEAEAYIQAAPIVGADETGFGQGKGSHPQSKRAWWLWVAVTPSVSFFQVMLSRSSAAAQAGNEIWVVAGNHKILLLS
ncbi:MAG: hypothetical protein EWV49_11150 [Microcystis aeruginosa Ma_QC_Ch_20071001_S25]|uniref:Transposase IS66 central domain-containing protein n=1 Tax=Microcystis aeruginosa Ma_QC_Ch_20071001_S25D TaxID=2486250 RepID=A0A552FPV8_MICAE|nr:MAG: hypothetical protein EWV57_13845 [Microcystis aeruginosa Ma_QC_Ch_20071001_S25D]TRU49539.1 MAG: hypothetical protein EWV49_11150 [Microcystis aeruginosa Ma_QC_Ch_20071001_S25]TRU64174.1 MAG: hypothetical protein EWV90_07215 [Microcystis aeruginosa Ma_QC_Ch_20071001_M135]CCI08288.1 hypothetical protein MICAD_3080032 [Microcystis aeruginosa PCC 7941]